MSTKKFKDWTQIDVANFIGTFEDGALRDYKQNIKRCNKFQGQNILKLNTKGLKSMISKELNLDESDQRFKLLFDGLKNLKTSNKKKPSKRRKSTDTKENHPIKIHTSMCESPAPTVASVSTLASTQIDLQPHNISQDIVNNHQNSVKILRLEKDNLELIEQNTELKSKNEKLLNELNKLRQENLNLKTENNKLTSKLKVGYSDTINWIMSLDTEDFTKYKNLFDYKEKIMNYNNNKNKKTDSSADKDQKEPEKPMHTDYNKSTDLEINTHKTDTVEPKKIDLEIDKESDEEIVVKKEIVIEPKKEKIKTVVEKPKSESSNWGMTDLSSSKRPRAPIGCIINKR